ncbi:MAG TPA: hypothetical protein VFX29_06570 [Longimicrobiaceae bacterium]|nr:hypothetical protein [Longimicrobiaceae bacterium]
MSDPFTEIRLDTLRTLAGANFWSRAPVTLLELSIGAYDEISSAEVPGFTDSLVEALPGLVEHRCSLGRRGGFVERLGRGTYAAHIVEHVALELQGRIGHEVGYGRARGDEGPGAYTVVFEHRHAGVGLRAGAHALEIVRRAFAGRLEVGGVEAALAELRCLARVSETAPLLGTVACGVTGGRLRHAVRAELARLGVPWTAPVVEVAPEYVVQAGLPYSGSRCAVIADAEVEGVPQRYAEHAARLLGVVADAVADGGTVIVPAGWSELHAWVQETGCRVLTFRDGCAAEAAALAAELLKGEEEGEDG